MKRLFSLFFLVVISLFLAGCEQTNQGLKDNKTVISVGETYTIELIGLTYDEVTFEIEDLTIATVSDDGIIQAIGPGKTIVEVKKGSKGWLFSLEVEGVPISITLETESLTLKKEGSQTIEVTTTDPQGLIFESLDESIATVDLVGLVTAIKEGETNIVIKSKTDENLVYNVTVTVVENVVIETKDEIAIQKGETQQLVYTTNDFLGLRFNSSDNEIVTVDNQGEIKAHGLGVANITLTSMIDSQVKKTIAVYVGDETDFEFNQAIELTNKLKNYTLKMQVNEVAETDIHEYNIVIAFDNYKTQFLAGHIEEYFVFESGIQYRYYKTEQGFVKEEVADELLAGFILTEGFSFQQFTFDEENEKHLLKLNYNNLLQPFADLFNDDAMVINFSLTIANNLIETINFEIVIDEVRYPVLVEYIDIDSTVVEVPNDA
ncbi:MAG: hypothetical protein GX149_02255 [Acholeplasmataceae bacterium]|jgi:hypothetical protein|nr:hypothetical protein [Acholeplasmataceae bacterium]